MSDPKNIPLDQARPGDMVFLKPQEILRLYSTRDHVHTREDGVHTRDGNAFHINQIDHINRPPVALEPTK